MKVTVYGYHKNNKTAEQIIKRALPGINVKFNHVERPRGLKVEIDEINDREEASATVRKLGGVTQLSSYFYQLLAQ